jgi:hypothetical protein
MVQPDRGRRRVGGAPSHLFGQSPFASCAGLFTCTFVAYLSEFSEVSVRSKQGDPEQAAGEIILG